MSDVDHQPGQAIILVSQWNTAAHDPYNVQQFVVNLNR
jgi:hypothetical protein